MQAQPVAPPPPPPPSTNRKMIVTRRCLGPGCSNTFKSPMTTDRQFCEKACRKKARGGKANRRKLHG